MRGMGEKLIERSLQCGMSALEGEFKMQEDLATMFSRNLTLANTVEQISSGGDSQGQAAPTPEQPAQPITYITQHYHHSAHVASAPTTVPNPSNAPIPTDIVQESPATVLSLNNINPSSLFPSQLTLFEQADSDQRLRLIQLWRISPPNYGSHDLARDLGNWPPTSLQREEEMAQLRHERKLMEQQNLNDMAGLHGTDEACTTDMVALGDGDGRPNAEPYILSGYEMLARRDYEDQAQAEQKQWDKVISHYQGQQSSAGHDYVQSTDPVFNGKEWWHNFVEKQTMEHQYGAFDHMNWLGSQSSVVVGGQGTEDEEML